MRMAGDSFVATKPCRTLITFAGTPTATEWAGMSSSTIEQAPTWVPSPIVMGPSNVAPAPSKQQDPTEGCLRVFFFIPDPPNVTLCSMLTLSPTMAVSPMTTPVPWSIKTPFPIWAPGWISIWKTLFALLWRKSARVGRPVDQSQCATLCVWSAWNPLKYNKTSTEMVSKVAKSEDRIVTSC